MIRQLRIGELAAESGTGVETIRYYERIGLLRPPARSAGNYRVYEEADARRLRFVRRARAFGFPLERVRQLLDLADDPSRDCARVDAIAREHLSEVERRIADLHALRGALERMVEHCAHGTVAECSVIEALAPDASADASPHAPVAVPGMAEPGAKSQA